MSGKVVGECSASRMSNDYRHKGHVVSLTGTTRSVRLKMDIGKQGPKEDWSREGSTLTFSKFQDQPSFTFDCRYSTIVSPQWIQNQRGKEKWLVMYVFSSCFYTSFKLCNVVCKWEMKENDVLICAFDLYSHIYIYIYIYILQIFYKFLN